ncbi:unnamed protein product, partial [Didymodactylos carnosus]
SSSKGSGSTAKILSSSKGSGSTARGTNKPQVPTTTTKFLNVETTEPASYYDYDGGDYGGDYTGDGGDGGGDYTGDGGDGDGDYNGNGDYDYNYDGGSDGGKKKRGAVVGQKRAIRHAVRRGMSVALDK